MPLPTHKFSLFSTRIFSIHSLGLFALLTSTFTSLQNGKAFRFSISSNNRRSSACKRLGWLNIFAVFWAKLWSKTD